MTLVQAVARLRSIASNARPSFDSEDREALRLVIAVLAEFGPTFDKGIADAEAGVYDPPTPFKCSGCEHWDRDWRNTGDEPKGFKRCLLPVADKAKRHFDVCTDDGFDVVTAPGFSCEGWEKAKAAPE